MTCNAEFIFIHIPTLSISAYAFIFPAGQLTPCLKVFHYSCVPPPIKAWNTLSLNVIEFLESNSLDQFEGALAFTLSSCLSTRSCTVWMHCAFLHCAFTLSVRRLLHNQKHLCFSSWSLIFSLNFPSYVSPPTPDVLVPPSVTAPWWLHLPILQWGVRFCLLQSLQSLSQGRGVYLLYSSALTSPVIPCLHARSWQGNCSCSAAPWLWWAGRKDFQQALLTP